MPYTKQTWTDEVPALTPVRYKISESTDGDITPDAKIELVTSVTAGSPVNAERLNYMEDGIETAQETAEAAIPKNLATAIGQLLYSTAANVWAALTKPSADSFLKMTSGGTPSWLSLAGLLFLSSRQGGSTSDWTSPGSNNYSISGTLKIEVGSVDVVIGSGNDTGTTSVTFNTTFTKKPIVFPVSEDLPGSNYQIPTAYSITTTGFQAAVTNPARNMTITVFWVAIGE